VESRCTITARRTVVRLNTQMKYFGWLWLIVLGLSGCGRPVQVFDENSQIDKEELLFFHNKERAINGNLPPLSASDTLSERAQSWAENMARTNNLTHSRLEISGTNFTMMGENIAYGYDTVESVVKGWMKSNGHRQNIMNHKFTEIGFGYAKLNGRLAYWCVQFGGRR
jgi:uncharacterized protein YkwD